MSITFEIQHRANVMFAELKGLSLYEGGVADLEAKDMQDGTEEKVRRVRTPAGVRRFKQPIGAIITNKGRALDNIKILDSVYDDWDLVEDKKGKRYDVGKDDGKWRAYGHNDWDDLVAESDTEDDLYEKLDAAAGPKIVAKPKSTKPRAKRRPWTLDRLDEEQPEQFNDLQDNFDDAEMNEYIRIRNEEGRGHDRAFQQVMDQREGASKNKPAPKKTGADVLKMLSPREKLDYDALPSEHQPHYVSGRIDGETHKEALKSVRARREAFNAERAPEDIGRRERVANRKPRSRAEARKRGPAVVEKPSPRQSPVLPPNDAEGPDGKTAGEHGDIIRKGPRRAILNSSSYAKGSTAYDDMQKTLDKLKNAQDQLLGHQRAVEAMPDSKARQSVLSGIKRDLNDARNKINSIEGQLAKRSDGDDRAPEDIGRRERVANRRPKSRAEARTERARQIANERHGANKPKAERTDAEIIEGLNNAFLRQFDTLSGSQKRKYLQAFREGKTHSEAMSAARGGDSGKVQGALF